jgi:hypothetical protein
MNEKLNVISLASRASLEKASGIYLPTTFPPTFHRKAEKSELLPPEIITHVWTLNCDNFFAIFITSYLISSLLRISIGS